MASKRKEMEDRIAALSADKRALVEKLLEQERDQTAPPRIEKRAAGSEVPLSFAQQRLWFFEQLAPGTPVYNMPLQLRLQMALDSVALERALNEIVQRHEVLRTTFKNVDGKPVQIIAQSLKLDLPKTDLRHLSPAERSDQLSALAGQEALVIFDLSTGPLIRFRLVRMDTDDYVLLLTMHHIVSDSWSMNIFFRELGALYAAFAAGRPSPLNELAIQYGDFAVWQRRWLEGETLDQQLAPWQKRLDGIAPIKLPYDRPRPAVASFRGAYVPVFFPSDLVSKVKTLSAQHDCTLFITMLAAFQVLLYRYSGVEDVVVGTPVANRNHAETEELIGFFINSLIMRANFAGNPTFREALARVREVALEAYANQDLPFEMLVEKLQPERDLTRNPLFQVLFQIQSMGGQSEASQASGSPGHALNNAVFDLNANLWEFSDSISGSLEYCTDLFDEATVARMVGHYAQLLQTLVDDPDRRIDELPILTESEREQLIKTWNATEHYYPKDRTILELIHDQVVKTPNALAVSTDSCLLSYAELDRRANSLAWRLHEIGVGRDDRIGIWLDRSTETIIALLGVLKAGAAYVPLDLEYPRDRVRFMLEDARVRAVITQESLVSLLPDPSPDLVVINQAKQDHAPKVEILPEDLAYIIYTSGSTGVPKGVAVPHRALLNSTWARLLYYDEPVERFLLVSPFTFDSSVAGIFWTLCTGGCLEIASRDSIGIPMELASEIERKQITHLLTVPSLFTYLLEVLNPGATRLRVAIVAGEPCPPALVHQHFQQLTETALYNEYGPTEAGVWATVYKFRPNDLGKVPIGRPVPNTRVYILDDYGAPVPIGVVGELWIAGDSIARGYWDRPELTAERFAVDAFSDDGGRAYRTGDRVRYLADGNIEFLGRVDQQVKLRGHRIELGEIEAALETHPAVAECAAFVIRHEDDARLFVHAIPTSEVVTIPDLIRHLEQLLPEYMIPRAITWVSSLPRNANGKLDRSALVADPINAQGSQTYVAPRTPIEETIAEMYKELLGLETPGIHHNFYRLGGHSLLATQLLSRVNKSFQLQLPLPVMFEAATIASLAAVVEKRILDEISALPDGEVERLVAMSPEFE